MTEKVEIVFEVTDRAAFYSLLERFTNKDGPAEYVVVGYRGDDSVHKRASLQKFTDAMELKLRRNDHKTAWRDLPVEALFRQLKLEVQELEVAMEFLTVAEARGECVDISNFGLILWDRLSLEDQDRNVRQPSS